MILSVSRRTDIPAFYASWFFNRVREGFVYVRNPMNPRKIARIAITPDVVDGMVFWTKNAAPMLPRLGELAAYPYYFSHTINSYGDDVEPGIPNKNKVVAAFLSLSEKLGPDRVVWRYDPILINQKYSVAYHVENFGRLAEKLGGATRNCIFGFLDFYKNTRRHAEALGFVEIGEHAMRELARQIAPIARANNIRLEACCEELDYSAFGVTTARCVDASIFERMTGVPLKTSKDANQRPECACHRSVDIGQYNSCMGGCLYCYANYNAGSVRKNAGEHHPNSPLLFGEPGPLDAVYDRKLGSDKQQQLRFEDV